MLLPSNVDVLRIAAVVAWLDTAAFAPADASTARSFHAQELPVDAVPRLSEQIPFLHADEIPLAQKKLEKRRSALVRAPGRRRAPTSLGDLSWQLWLCCQVQVSSFRADFHLFGAKKEKHFFFGAFGFLKGRRFELPRSKMTATLATACGSEVQLWSVNGEKKLSGGLRLPTGASGSMVTGMLWCKGGQQPIAVTTKVGCVGVYYPTGEREESFVSVGSPDFKFPKCTKRASPMPSSRTCDAGFLKRQA